MSWLSSGWAETAGLTFIIAPFRVKRPLIFKMEGAAYPNLR